MTDETIQERPVTLMDVQRAGQFLIDNKITLPETIASCPPEVIWKWALDSGYIPKDTILKDEKKEELRC